MKNLSIRNKLIAGFLVVVLLTALVGVAGIAGVIYLDDRKAAQDEYAQATMETAHLMKNLYQQQTLMLSVTTGTRDDAAELDELEAEFLALLQALQTRSLPDDLARQRLDEILQVYTSRYAPLQDRFVELVNGGGSVQSGTLMTDIDGTIAAMQNTAVLLDAQMGEVYADWVSRGGKTSFGLKVGLAVTSLAALAVAVVLSIHIAKLIVRPVRKMVQAAEKLAVGDIDVDIDYVSDDEIGTLARSFGNMVEGIRGQAALLRAISEGDYSMEVQVRSGKDVINRAIQTVLDTTNRVLEDIRGASSQVSAASEQLTVGAQTLASGSSVQASSIEQFTLSLSDLGDKTKQNAKNAAKAQQSNNDAHAALQESIASMKDMLAAMEEIDRSSQDITKVIKVIDDIAFQTNILALNAAVEAARAGVHGKGFAVVADEVRNLAAKSAEAAQETAVLIDGSSQKVAEGNRLVQQTSSRLESAMQSSETLHKLVNRVATASEEQARNIGEIEQGIDQISSVVQSNSATAEQSAAATSQMAAQSSMLSETVSRFRLREGVSESFSASPVQSGSPRGAAEVNRDAPKDGFSLRYEKY